MCLSMSLKTYVCVCVFFKFETCFLYFSCKKLFFCPTYTHTYTSIWCSVIVWFFFIIFFSQLRSLRTKSSVQAENLFNLELQKSKNFMLPLLLSFTSFFFEFIGTAVVVCYDSFKQHAVKSVLDWQDLLKRKNRGELNSKNTCNNQLKTSVSICVWVLYYYYRMHRSILSLSLSISC